MASVLIIHERSDICELLSPVIEDHGHACAAHPSCAAAIQALEQTTCDIVILDIDTVPRPDQDITSLIRTRCRPHVLAITNGHRPELLEDAISAGAWDIIVTPFTQEELEQAINRCLFHRRAQREHNGNGGIRRDTILGTSACLDRCLQKIGAVAQSNISVLILGETGTGKELFAHAIHENSARAAHKFIVVDCTNIPKTLAESLLFGHERGSFTGAGESREGLFKQADGGTIFLDEIGDLDFDVQKSLLRVLQERRFRPLSSKNEIASDFRLIAATNRNIDDMVKQGVFRKDLYHRLHTSVIHLPPLRARKEDIEPIANFHVRRICDELKCPPKEISHELHKALTLYDWPGNVRELINILYATLHNGIAEHRLYPQHLPVSIRTQVLLKRPDGPPTEGYLVKSKIAPPHRAQPNCGPACPALKPARDLPPKPRVAAPADTCGNFGPRAANFPSPAGLADPGQRHKPDNGCAQFENPCITLPVGSNSATENTLLPLRAVRELAMQEVEAVYLKRLAVRSQGNFQRAQTMSGLSRARLYDLLHKHSMSLNEVPCPITLE